ncbi:MAG: metallophosphoesterase family protein [Vagococcus sp.]
MKFIHTADLHLDQPFSGIDTEDPSVQRHIKDANRNMFTNIIDTCIKESVDFLLIVGDTFHQPHSSIYTQQFLMAQFERLQAKNIQVVVSFGNHDYYTANKYWFDWPENVLVFQSETVETKRLSLQNGESISISGFSYEHRWIDHSMASQFPDKNRETTYHIGFYHGEIGHTGHYAPFTMSDLPVSYDYWGLGHIHKSYVAAQHPLAIYPGTPQGHTKKETQTSGVVLVELTQTGQSYDWIDVSMVEWHSDVLEVSDVLEKNELLSQIESHVLGRDYDKALNLIQLELRLPSSQLSSDLIETKDEWIRFVQESLLKSSSYRVWVVDVSLVQASSDKLLMGFDSSLIDDLSKKYEDTSEFNKVARDILQQGVISSYVDWTNEDIRECVRESSQLIKDKMMFKNEASQ